MAPTGKTHRQRQKCGLKLKPAALLAVVPGPGPGLQLSHYFQPMWHTGLAGLTVPAAMTRLAHTLQSRSELGHVAQRTLLKASLCLPPPPKTE